MPDREILRRLLEVKDLPTLPHVVAKILETADDADSTVMDLAELISSDHAISIRILRLANSAFYGMKAPVDSIQGAVVVIGFDAVRQLALATSVINVISAREQFALDAEDFWMHSLGTAKAAQLLCKEHCTVESPEGCFTAGLLHDIGKYLLAMVLGDEYKEVAAEAERSKRSLSEVEMVRLETTHWEVGRWLAEKWRFHAVITNVIGEMHHAWAYAGAHSLEVAVVALANEISCLAGFGLAGDWGVHELDGRVLEMLGISKAVAEAVVDELRQTRDATLEYFDVLHEAEG